MIDQSSITKLLAQKHSKDIFVPQCKTGPTWTVGKDALFILDAWTMKKSWTNTITTGYEIKITRQDFLNDNKWQSYLPYCNEFYFVCPSGVILPTELPPQAGLYYVSKTGARLFVKKKSARRDVELPHFLLYYILMWRAKIVKDSIPSFTSKRAYWESWLKDCKIDRDFGSRVGKKIRQTIEDRILKVEQENARLLSENNTLTNVKNLLQKWDLNVNRLSRWNAESILKEKILLIEKGIPKGLIESLSGAIRNLETIREIFQKEGA